MIGLDCEISIGSLKLKFVNSLEIESSMKKMTDSCVIKFAKKIIVERGGIERKYLQQVIKPGQKVMVRIGYDKKLKTEFVGYVSKSVKPGPPVEVTCEDSMYLLKRQKVVKKTFVNAKLKDVLKYVAPGFKVDCFDMSMGRSFACEDTGAKTFKIIEDVYGIKTFFRLVGDAPVLISGKIYSSEDLVGKKPVKYILGKNEISNSLEYNSKEDKRIKVKAISKRENAKDVTVEVGDDDGDVRSLHLDLNLSEAELKRRATLELEKFKFDGYSGDLTGFGIPFVRHGMAVTIIDEDYDRMEGTYLVDAVRVNFGVDGFRRTITTGPVVTDDRIQRKSL